jgi:hypothetical protein
VLCWLCWAQAGVDARFKPGAPPVAETCGQLVVATAPPLRVVFKTCGGLRLYLVRLGAPRPPAAASCDEAREARQDTTLQKKRLAALTPLLALHVPCAGRAAGGERLRHGGAAGRRRRGRVQLVRAR